MDRERRVATWLAWVSVAAGLCGAVVAHAWGTASADCGDVPDTVLGILGTGAELVGFVLWLLVLGLVAGRAMRRRRLPPRPAGHLAVAVTCASAVYVIGGFWTLMTSLCGP